MSFYFQPPIFAQPQPQPQPQHHHGAWVAVTQPVNTAPTSIMSQTLATTAATADTTTTSTSTATTTAAAPAAPETSELLIRVLFWGRSAEGAWSAPTTLSYPPGAQPTRDALLVALRDWASRQTLTAEAVAPSRTTVYLTAAHGQGPPGLTVRPGSGPETPKDVVRKVKMDGARAADEVDEALGAVARRGYGVFVVVDLGGGGDADGHGDASAGETSHG